MSLAVPPDFRAVVEVPVAWGDMDAFGHVNNALYFRYLESARVEYLLHRGWFDHQKSTGIGVILHSVQARFRAPVVFPDTLAISARVTDIQSDRFTLDHEIVSCAHNTLVATGSGIIVAYSYTTQSKVPIPQPLHAAMTLDMGK